MLLETNELTQPLYVKEPEPGHEAPAMTISHFINLLKEEEDYFEGEQHNTKLMITRLRKIFYDKWGWNSEVIRGATDIQGRYKMAWVPNNKKLLKRNSFRNGRKAKNYEDQPGKWEATYRKGDKVYPERAGQVPEVYANDAQETVLESGYFCDIAHVLSGLDAYNYFSPMSPLPNRMMWLRKLFPWVKSNMDFATWLGDIGSTAGDYLFELTKGKSGVEVEQKSIDSYSPGSDMLGNIDAYVFAKCYDVKTDDGIRVTDMFSEFYLEGGKGATFRENRIGIYCEFVGLGKWNPEKGTFSKESEWKKEYVRQLRNATCFYIFGMMETFHGIILATKVWFRMYDKKLRLEELLDIYIDALKEAVKKEPINYNKVNEPSASANE